MTEEKVKKQKTREDVMNKIADESLKLFQKAKLTYFEATGVLAMMNMIMIENWKIDYSNRELIKKAQVYKEGAKRTAVT